MIPSQGLSQSTIVDPQALNSLSRYHIDSIVLLHSITCKDMLEDEVGVLVSLALQIYTYNALHFKCVYVTFYF